MTASRMLAVTDASRVLTSFILIPSSCQQPGALAVEAAETEGGVETGAAQAALEGVGHLVALLRRLGHGEHRRPGARESATPGARLQRRRLRGAESRHQRGAEGLGQRIAQAAAEQAAVAGLQSVDESRQVGGEAERVLELEAAGEDPPAVLRRQLEVG